MKRIDMCSVSLVEFANYVSSKNMNKKVSYFIERFTKASVDAEIRSKDSFQNISLDTTTISRSFIPIHLLLASAKSDFSHS